MRKKFLDPASIEETLEEIALLARQEGVKIALIGGVAMELLGSDRMTEDVDFVCSAVVPHLLIRHVLTFGGVAASTSLGYPVDLVVRNDAYAPLYEEALQNAVAQPGLPVVMVLPEHLAAMKMAAGRDKDELDLKALIRLGAVTLEKTADVVKRHLGLYAERELKEIFDKVAWLSSRGDE